MSPVTEQDIPIVSRAVYSSKLPLTINRLLYKNWPNEDAQMKQGTNAVTSSLKNPLTEIFSKVVDGETGEIVGHVVLTRQVPAPTKVEDKEKDELKEKNEQASAVPEGMDERVIAAVVKGTMELRQEMEKIEHLGQFLLFPLASATLKNLLTPFLRVDTHLRPAISSRAWHRITVGEDVSGQSKED
jgi:hypothetical protein